jgi:hypothetical protein
VLDDASPGTIGVLARKGLRTHRLPVGNRVEDFAMFILRLGHVGAVEPAETQFSDERDVLGLALHRS